LNNFKNINRSVWSNIMAKKFSDDELDVVLSKIKKFDTDGIRFVHLKNSVKKIL